MVWPLNMQTKEVGKQGEDEAAKYLKNKGYKIIERNWRIKQGELDIIAKHKGITVFVEVKTIKEKDGFSPEDEITPKKKRRLVRLAQLYFSKNKLPLDTKHRIDILSITLAENSPKIQHFENAIEDIY